MSTWHRALTGLLALLPWVGAQAAALGPLDGALRPCPASPNCVCSCSSDDAHRIEPLRHAGDAGPAWQALQRALATMERVEIVRDEGGYMHAQFTSKVFRFVDDVEFLADPEAGVIHVRSASRVGYSDLGANRRRVEAIRVRFAQELAGAGR
jgi:uncharacterized protein (DUF1499 family)